MVETTILGHCQFDKIELNVETPRPPTKSTTELNLRNKEAQNTFPRINVCSLPHFMCVLVSFKQI